MSNYGREKSKVEKLLRLVKLPSKKELLIKKYNIEYHCFSIRHAASIINVSQQEFIDMLNSF